MVWSKLGFRSPEFRSPDFTFYESGVGALLVRIGKKFCTLINNIVNLWFFKRAEYRLRYYYLRVIFAALALYLCIFSPIVIKFLSVWVIAFNCLSISLSTMSTQWNDLTFGIMKNLIFPSANRKMSTKVFNRPPNSFYGKEIFVQNCVPNLSWFLLDPV